MTADASVWHLAITSRHPDEANEYGLAVRFDDEPDAVAMVRTLETGQEALREYEAERGLSRGRDRYELSKYPVEEAPNDG